MNKAILLILPLLLGWIADRFWGDPVALPHPIVGFGKLISRGEKKLNKGNYRKLKGAVLSIFLICFVFTLVYLIQFCLDLINPCVVLLFNAILVFFCLAGKTLSDEVKTVFLATDRSLEEGRLQVARIVGRDTSQLSSQKIRIAALETLSENLSDGVIAPLFWYLLLGVPGMVTYKMINTLDSMIGYKNEKYKDFGCFSAHIDDIANYIPARLTAVLMILVSGRLSLFSFVKKYGTKHASPNSGFPEATLAGILNCRFGGPNVYFGKVVDKPYIGENDREITTQDMQKAISINKKTETLMVGLVVLILVMIHYCI